MKIGIVIFPGSNCDHDMYYALKKIIGEDVHFIWHRDISVEGYDAVILPGGFSYGDYLRAGAIARFSPILQAIVDFASSGKPVVGICNGFQVLTECALLPGALMRNQNLRFVCKHVNIRTENNGTMFTNKLEAGQILSIPVAHGEGNYFIDDTGYRRLVDNNQILFRYCNPDGELTEEANPNGSRDFIAGIMDKEGNVLGMMPHPERAVEILLGSEDGRFIFESMLR
ncbi:MAG: phosphoribosylformylglycinamidine synthase I [Calditrichaeota bacterium]|nr:phosphoribosylformylglycinamidine synthase I [Calditrichota bacterium]RQW04676.1 MAG: phosphoribosylformylglycinamidine synthase I [Calditrichota bacterium]